MKQKYNQKCGFQKGKKHSAWKGDKVGYFGLHARVVKKFGKANHCEECGLDKMPKGYKIYFQWANISHTYKRDLSDFKQMCIPCHIKFDKGCGRGKRGKNKQRMKKSIKQQIWDKLDKDGFCTDSELYKIYGKEPNFDTAEIYKAEYYVLKNAKERFAELIKNPEVRIMFYKPNYKGGRPRCSLSAGDYRENRWWKIPKGYFEYLKEIGIKEYKH